MLTQYNSSTYKNEKPSYFRPSIRASRLCWTPSANTPQQLKPSELLMNSKPRTRRLLMLLLLLTCAALNSACASRSPLAVQSPCPSLAPPPAALMEQEPQNLTQRLQREFGLSPQTVSEQ